MSKLFFISMEENKDDVDPNIDTSDLLINKLMKYAKVKKESEGISVTADIVKERDKLKSELKEEFNKEKKEDDDQGNTSNDSNEDNQDNNEDNNEQQDNKDNNKDNNTEDNKDSNEDSKNKDEEPTDEEEAASDPDKLESMIGSAVNNKDKDTTDKDNSKDSNEKDPLAMDSYREKLTLCKCLKPLQVSYKNYKNYLREKFALEALSIENIPIAYTKEDIIKTLNNLIQLSLNLKKYNEQMVEKRKNGLMTLNKTAAVITEAYKNDRLHIIFKVVEDRDLLFTLANEVDTNIPKSVRTLTKYLTNADNLIKSLLTNSLKNYNAMVQASNFEYSKEDGSYVYNELLPNFTQVHLNEYKEDNYLTTDVEEASCYKVVITKQNTIASLEPVQITKDNELSTLIKGCDELVINVSISLDNQLTVSKTLDEISNKLKTLIYDIENNVIKDYKSVKIEEKIDEIARLKLVSNFSSMNIDITLNFLTSLVAFLGIITEVK